jgi:hypothetical protein
VEGTRREGALEGRENKRLQERIDILKKENSELREQLPRTRTVRLAKTQLAFSFISSSRLSEQKHQQRKETGRSKSACPGSDI